MRIKFFAPRFVAVLLAASLFTACKKDEEIPKGVSWKFDGTSMTAAQSNAVSRTTFLAISGNRDNGNTYPYILVVFPKRTGTFNFSGTDATASYVISSSGSNDYDAVSGSVTVTSYSTSNVKGTFSFTGERPCCSGTKSVSDGKFNIDY